MKMNKNPNKHIPPETLKIMINVSPPIDNLEAIKYLKDLIRKYKEEAFFGDERKKKIEYILNL